MYYANSDDKKLYVYNITMRIKWYLMWLKLYHTLILIMKVVKES